MPTPSESLYPSEGLLPERDGDLAPTLDELAQLCYARTRDRATDEMGAWTANTHPDATGASKKLDQAVSETLARWPTLPFELWPLGRMVSLYRAAVLIEQSYYPEDTGAGDAGTYAELYADWERYSRELTRQHTRRRPRSQVNTVRLQSRSDEWRQRAGLMQSTDDWDLDGLADSQEDVG